MSTTLILITALRNSIESRSLSKFSFLFVFLFVISSTFFAGCKKPEQVIFLIKGKLTDDSTSQPIEGVQVSLQAKLLTGGAFNNNFQDLKEQETTQSGEFEFCIARDNFGDMKIQFEKEGYFYTEKIFSPSDIDVDLGIDLPEALSPISEVSVAMTNISPGDESDLISFRFTNSNFPECACCDNQVKNYSGTEVDTLVSCFLTGNYNLKYLYSVTKFGSTTVTIDSIFVPAFSNPTIDINY